MYKSFIIIILLYISVSSYSSIQNDNINITVDSTLIIYKSNTIDSLIEESFKCKNTCPEKGINLSNRALILAREINDKEREALALYSIGINLYLKGEYSESYIFQLQALKINQAINNKRRIANGYDCIGTLLKELKQLDEAILYYKKAIRIHKELKNEYGLAISIGNIGIVYRMQNKQEKSIEYIKKSLKIFEKNNEKFEIARSLHNLGNSYYDLEQFDKALLNFNQALNIFINTNNCFGQMITHHSLGKTYIKTKNYSLAEEHLLKALSLRETNKSRPTIAKVYHYAYELYEAKNDYKEALKYLILEKNLRDSFISEESIKQINFAKTKYETEIKEKENIILKNNNEIKQSEIRKQSLFIIVLFIFLISIVFIIIVLNSRYRLRKRANNILIERNNIIKLQKNTLIESINRLNLVNTEKDKLISLISHDLKNPFNVIIGLSSLISDNYDSLDDEERKEYISKICDASQRAFNLLENILTWSKTQLKGFTLNIKNHNLKQLINKSIDALILIANQKSIEINNNINNNIELHCDNFTISTVINNLVSNAIKFTHRGGYIDISCEEQSDCTNIIISDTGVGIPSSKIKNIFNVSSNISTQGTNNEKGTGLGLLICNEFIKLHNGTISVESEENKGTKFIISLPL